jgi:hypothetical protein
MTLRLKIKITWQITFSGFICITVDYRQSKFQVYCIDLNIPPKNLELNFLLATIEKYILFPTELHLKNV